MAKPKTLTAAERITNALPGEVIKITKDEARGLNPEMPIPKGVSIEVEGVHFAPGATVGPDGDGETRNQERGKVSPPKVNNQAPPQIGDRVLFFDVGGAFYEPRTPRAALVTGIGDRGLHLTIFANPSLDCNSRGSSPVLTRTNVPWSFNDRPAELPPPSRWCQSALAAKPTA